MTQDLPHTTIESLLAQSGWLDALARHLVADPHEADEIVQETWIAALKHPPATSVPMRAWLARVARNFAIQRGRSEKARRQREHSVSRDEAQAGDGEALDRARTHRRLVDAVLELEEPYRSTVVLHYFDRMPVAEVAARQAVSESTVRTRLSRAIGKLRTRFQDEDGAQWSAAFVVLARGSVDAGAVPAGASPSTWVPNSPLIGGLVMATAWKIGAGLVAVIALGWWLWPSHETPARAVDAVVASAPEPIPLTSTDEERIVRVPLAAQPSQLATAPAPVSANTSHDRAALDVDVRWGDDGTSAEGIDVTSWQAGAPDAFRYQRSVTTDAHGRAHFEGLYPGGVNVILDRSEGAHIELAPGVTAHCDITIPNGVDVDVRVVDMKREPAPGAHIWISAYGNRQNGHEVGIADGAGRFQVRDLGPGRALAALRDENGPSAELRIEAKPPGSRVEVVLALTEPMGLLKGTVRDAKRMPVPDADVEVLAASDPFGDGSGLGEVLQFPPVCLRTDAAGSFAVRDLRQGENVVTVLAPGFAPWKGAINGAETGRTLDVELQVQAVVHGWVRNSAGAPIANVAVVSGYYGSRTGSQCWTHADGTYRLEGLPAGSIGVRVNARGRGDSGRSFVLSPGDDVEWNVTLESKPDVTGRVADENGGSLAGWKVRAVEKADPDSPLREAMTDVSGAFTLPSWPERADSIAVCEADALNGEVAAVIGEVKAGRRGILVTIPPGKMRNAFLLGRVIGPDGLGAGATKVTWYPSDSNRRYSLPTDVDGRFRIGPLMAGTYEIAVPLGTAKRELHGLVLAREQELDVGDMHFDGAGSLNVRLRGLPATIDDKFPPVLRLCAVADRAEQFVEVRKDTCRIDGLRPGAYEVELRDLALRALLVTATVESGGVADVEIVAETATCRALRFDWPDGSVQPKHVRLRIFDAHGAKVHEEEYPAELRNALAPRLVVGEYRIEASTDTGLTAQAALKVDSLALSSDVLVLHLR